jgi:hypothetical protein
LEGKRVIELNEELRQVVNARPGEPVELVDPITKQTFVLLKTEVYDRLKELRYDDSPWTSVEMSAMAGMAFSKLDDTDYSEYLQDRP